LVGPPRSSAIALPRTVGSDTKNHEHCRRFSRPCGGRIMHVRRGRTENPFRPAPTDSHTRVRSRRNRCHGNQQTGHPAHPPGILGSPVRPTTGPTGRPCQALGCGVTLTATTFMCDAHWLMIPPALRAAVNNNTDRPEPSCEDLLLRRGAIDAIAHAEARRARQTRPPRKPVQLTLF